MAELSRSKLNLQVDWQAVRMDLYQDRLLYWFVLFSSLVTAVIVWFNRERIVYQYQFDVYLSLISTCLSATFICWVIYYYFRLMFQREPRPFLKFYQAVKAMVWPLNRPLTFAVRILLLNICFANYTYIKEIIPELQPFQFDEAFYRWDQWLHGGVDPWQLTHAVFANQYASLFLNVLYHLWFFFLWGSFLYFVCVCRQQRLRLQFLLSLLVCWFVLGNLLAIALSSAGPCFIQLLEPANSSYQPLMALLEQQNLALKSAQFFELWALNVQDLLWQAHTHRGTQLGSGISAMPSMHVASAVLFALGAYQVNKRLGWVMWGYAALIQVGSVHLAWHYAVDGYVAAAATLLIWFSVKWLLSRTSSC